MAALSERADRWRNLAKKAIDADVGRVSANEPISDGHSVQLLVE
jgi:hypothetical protein